MRKRSEFKSALARIEALPADRRETIEAGAAKIVEEMRLAEVRKVMSMKQQDVAAKSGMKQAEVSRIERAPETAQLRTLERYAKSLGGTLSLTLSFPDGTRTAIDVHNGKPVKSKIRATFEPNERKAEAVG